ncbi:AraC family transcriptional regulator [Streptomyces sp. NBC_01723]|uniref:AraC family transcriptional regulator n=1 Tax=Streptomyces sp. NBC_01723 TaxID=2975921 RepID=UPI003FCCA6CB
MCRREVADPGPGPVPAGAADDAGRPAPMEFVTEADVVLIGAQCSGALVLARLGLLEGMPACTDMKRRASVEGCGVTVLDAPFHAEGNITTAGGCLASQHLATWVITRILGEDAARAVIDYVAPVGDSQETPERAMRAVHAGVVALR